MVNDSLTFIDNDDSTGVCYEQVNVTEKNTTDPMALEHWNEFCARRLDGHLAHVISNDQLDWFYGHWKTVEFTAFPKN